MLLYDILPTFPHKEGMVYLPELHRPVERCNKVSCYDAGRRPVFSRGMSKVMEDNHRLFDQQTGDFLSVDMRHGPLKKFQEEFFL